MAAETVLAPEAQAAVLSDDAARLAALLGEAPGSGPEALQACCVLGAAACCRTALAACGGWAALVGDWRSWSALHHAAQAGHAEVLGVLLEGPPSEGAVDVRTEETRISRLSYLTGGLTPLHLAAASGERPAVELLLQARADPEAVDDNGWSAADHARGRADVLAALNCVARSPLSPAECDEATRRRCEARVAALSSSDFAELCGHADAGWLEPLRGWLRCADVKNVRVGTATALQAATCLGCPEGVRLIVEVFRQQGKLGHDTQVSKALPLPTLDAVDAMGFAPIHSAVETGFVDCFAPLLEARADVDVRTADASYSMGQTTIMYTEGGRTSLHLAVAKARPDMVAALLRGGARAAAADSFGHTALDLARAALAFLPARDGDRRQVLSLLGLSALEVEAAVASRGSEAEARARQQAQQHGLQRRIAEQRERMEAETRAANRRAIQERYRPLDEAIARGELGDAATLAVAIRPRAGVDLADQNAGMWSSAAALPGTPVEEPTPGVFVFPLLSEALCAGIWAETEHYLAAAAECDLPLPVRHDGCLDLSHVFPELLAAIAGAARPAIRAVLPPELREVRLRHAFRTNNFVGRDEDYKRHVDKYAVTLNVCLHKTADARGSGVFFFGSGQPEASAAHRHEHAVGLAVLHSSREWHQTEAIAAGERGSVVMWFEATGA